MTCPSCGADNRPDARFCASCGSPLERRCPNGHPVSADARFCDQCGVALGTESRAPVAPAAERRLVSVLFADLVGFTPLSETRDPEEVRELLSTYFDMCRRLIELYGGTVEKFIGDAVMAVWGTPVAQEDDAERAVRTALDLVQAIPELDSALQARAGVLTGEAAVTLAAEGEGMVAGDLVNTAARVQALADPGTVLVGEATKRASEAAIAYADAGSHELKGKAEPVPLWRALRVTASRGGAVRTEALEPPFVGRNRELRLVKELFHASAEEDKPHLVSIVGIAGIGKSRLAWEFEKYIDGLADSVWWHRGRCLAYGEGVAYWALVEMVRMRAGITEEEPPGPALAKLRASIDEHVSDPEERAWLEPRLAHLLGLAERTAPDRADLFSGWRLFFERLSERNPTVLVFEDLQWADAALLDFVEYLLEWSRGHSLYVLALARPELSERRPSFGAGSRNATTLALEPLATEAMEALLDGFVPGLPADLRRQVLERAEGVPLYAVETVRMLLDRGLLTREGEVYRPTGAIEALAVPETLHALIAARLDGLSPEERRVVQDASVLGKTFTKGGLEALSGLPADGLDPIVAGLVRKEIFSVQSDPRSPERGQYTFLQDLLRRVAYETLARKDRKARHLAAAGHLEQAWASEQEVVEVVAAHYVDAYRAAPEADDAREIKARAVERLVLAAERAASLTAWEEAESYFEQAAELSDEVVERAGLLEKAGLAAVTNNRLNDARALFERSIELFQSAGATHPAARVSGRLGIVLWMNGDLAGGARQAEEAFAVLADDEPDADLADLAAHLARFLFFLGRVDESAEKVERALEIAEALVLPAVLAEALNNKHLVLDAAGRSEEALALLERALVIAREHDLGSSHTRALFNLAYQNAARDDALESKRIDLEGLALSRRRGDRGREADFLMHLVANHYWLGEWDEAVRAADELREIGSSDVWHTRLIGMPALLVNRGQVAEARRELEAEQPDLSEVQARVLVAMVEATILRAEGRPADALRTVEEVLGEGAKMGRRHPFVKLTLVQAMEAAFDLDDLDKVTDLLGEWERMRPADRTPFYEGQRERFVARLAALRGERETAEDGYRRAGEIFRGLQMPFHLAVALLELGELTGDEAALAEAREIFARLEAKPWLERAAAARAADPAPLR